MGFSHDTSGIGPTHGVLTAGGGGLEIFPFQGYRSLYLGGGSPPADQGRRFKLRTGRINGYTPSNMGTEFTCPANSTLIVWGKAEVSPSDRRVSSAILDSGAELPDAPAGDSESGAPPAWTLRAFCEVTANATEITEINPVVTDSQWVSVVCVAFDPATGTPAYDLTWASAGSRGALYLE
jgi:hypothetical protein